MEPNGEGRVDWQELESLFLELVELDESRRTARLAQVSDEVLRREIESMLVAHEGPELAVEARLLSITEHADLAGERVGPYRLLDLVGRGGMGEVYRARREDEVYDRLVAVKLVRPGFGRNMHERFARERTILARLTHPDVATLHDGGLTEDGRPYLVMEFVEGLPITDHCDAARLTVRERIELFLTVCDAVQSAHAALVIHRDLKPSNILIDGGGRPRLLDFGIARLLEDEETGQTIGFDRLLTPEHAAPEQIRGSEPTTAADVYGLGVLLCELLVGERPLRFDTLSPVEIDRIAHEVLPSVPSKLLEGMARDDSEERAGRRRTSPERLRGALRGDLDAICAMALRKERNERYASVSEMAEDLRRHLDARPVRAIRGSRTYVARKFVQRHATSLTMSTLAFAALAGFLFVSVHQAREVRIQRDLARAESARATLVLDRLVALFETTGPQVAGRGDLLDVDEFLRRGEETAEWLADDPVARAQVLAVLADIHANRGALGRAIELLEEARDLADDEPTRMQRQHRLARLRTRHEGVEVGLPLLRASREQHVEALGPHHPDAIQATIDFGRALDDEDAARGILETALLRLGEAATEELRGSRASALNALAGIEIRAAELGRARSLLEEADALLARSLPEWAGPRISVRHNLSSVYARLGLWEQAEVLQRRLVDLRRRVSGPSSDRLAVALEAHGVSLANLGRHDESAARFAAALEIFEESLDPGHWRIANSLRNVGRLLDLGGRHADALGHFDRAVRITESAGRRTAHLRGQRALALWSLGRYAQARAEFEDVVREIEAASGEYGRAALSDALFWLGMAQTGAGDREAAMDALRRALTSRRALHGDGHPRTDEALCALALAEEAVGTESLSTALERYRGWGLADPRLLAMIEASIR